jgi:hypothetical protein
MIAMALKKFKALDQLKEYSLKAKMFSVQMMKKIIVL